MAIDSTLSALLEEKAEPSPAIYRKTVDKFIEDPDQVSCLTETDVQEDILFQLATHSDRLVRFFNGLRSVVRANPQSQSTTHIAAGLATFFEQILPNLHQLLLQTKLLEVLISGLEICLAPSQLPPLRKLASVIARCGRLLECLASDPRGSQVLRQWACTSVSDVPTLESWTERLVKMVDSCKMRHDVAQTIQEFDTLRNLKSHLRSLEARHSGELSGHMARNEILPLSSMAQLSKEDKKTRCTRGQEPKTTIPAINENMKRCLKAFDLPDPKSWAALRNVIERLEGDETSKILLSVTTHFPCELCLQGMTSSPQAPEFNIPDESVGAVSNLHIEILGKALGPWQMLLSAQALRSLQEMGVQGTLELRTAYAATANMRQVSLIRLEKS